jgi:nitrite reductase (NO-forming)
LRANLLVVAWLASAAVVAVAHRFVPEPGWLMVHLLLLGGVSTAILVWSQHFADTLVRRPGSTRALTVRLAVHTAGTLAVVAGVVAGSTAAVVVGAAAVAGVACAQTVGIARQRRGALPARFAHLVMYYLVAGSLLVPGVACGVVMARLEPGPEAYARWYVAHVALTLLGWVAVTVAGTLAVLWPTVLHARIDVVAERDARRALPLLGAGPVLVALAAAADVRPGVGLGAAVSLAGTVLVARVLVRQARAAAPLTFAGWSLAAAVAWWAGATVALGAAVVTAGSWAAAVPRLTGLVPALVVGFAAQVLAGALAALLPVVLGGGPAGSRRTAAELDRAGVLRCVLLNGALLLFLSGAPSLVRVVTSLVGLGAAIAFLVLVVRAVRVSRAPAEPSPAVTTDAAGAPGTPDAPGATGVHELDLVARGRRRGAVTAGVGALLLAVSLGVAADPTAAGLTGPVGGSEAAEGATTTGRTTTVTVEAQDMQFVPARIEVPAGDRLVLEVTNTDSTVHDLVLDGGATTGRLAPGASATVDVGVVGSDLAGWCSVAGHRLMGMTLEVVVTGTGAGTATGTATATDAGDSGHSGHTEGATASADATATVDLHATADPAFEARDAALPAVEPGTTHRLTLTVTETEQEVAPGVTRTAWTFGSTAPGPVLHGRVGDTFVITLVNDGTIGHSVDFHAGALAPDDVMRTIPPGETLTYTFTAERSGIWMYHCSTMPMSLHIANGMAGAVVIDPPGLPEVDREYVLVQSEVYLGAPGGPADEAKVAAQTPDLLVFNGYASQYRDRPLAARAGERVRVWVLDAGPNRPSAFHVVGAQFDTVFREGDWVLRDGGSTGTGGSQVLALQPAEGGFVELTFPEAGTYPFVTHVMADAERGAQGRFLVTP